MCFRYKLTPVSLVWFLPFSVCSVYSVVSARGALGIIKSSPDCALVTTLEFAAKKNHGVHGRHRIRRKEFDLDQMSCRRRHFPITKSIAMGAISTRGVISTNAECCQNPGSLYPPRTSGIPRVTP